LEYQISVDPIALSSFGLSLESVNTALKSKNINLPLDSVNTSDGEHAITIDERIYKVDEILNLPLTQLTNTTTNSQGIIRIKDIASVRAHTADRNTISRFAPQMKSG
jgi:multidrug efflux pump subunit AcrB